MAQLQLLDMSVPLASMYVKGSNVVALGKTKKLLDDAINLAHHRSGPRLSVIIAGDFNRHDQSWGGDEVAPRRQGEAGSITDVISRWSLESLLRHGAKTWHDRRHASTIALMLAL